MILPSVKYIIFSHNMRQYGLKLLDVLVPRISSKFSHYLMKNSFHVSRQRPSEPSPLFRNHENEFINYFPVAVQSVTDSYNFSEMEDVLERLKTLLEYNVPTGENISGITTIISYKMLVQPQNITKENVGLANILGWCAEILEASSSVAEDFVNDSETRSNAPCWFRLPGIDRNAALDIFILEHCIYSILKKHLAKHPFYIPITEFFHDLMYNNTAGHILETQKLEIENMNMDVFNKITEYKTGCNTLYVGVTLGMYLSKTFDIALFEQVRPILIDMGRYFMIKNHMEDWLADTITGNFGEDIKRGKCTWSIVQALKKADPSQRKLIEDNYGKPEEEAIETIKNLYQNLDIAAEFSVYEEETYRKLSTDIANLTDVPMRNLLHFLIEQLYRK